MPSFRNMNPMSSRPQEEKDRFAPEDVMQDVEHVNGTKVPVTRYRDGSSTVHWGGPCPDTHYDAYGEEC